MRMTEFETSGLEFCRSGSWILHEGWVSENGRVRVGSGLGKRFFVKGVGGVEEWYVCGY